MKKMLFIITGLFTVFYATSQGATWAELKIHSGSKEYLDSLVLTSDAGREIKFQFVEMNAEEEYFSSVLWESILNVMETAIERSETQEGIRVVYEFAENESARIRITNLEPVQSVFLIQKDGIEEVLSSRIEFLIIQSKVAVSFTIHDVEELEEIKDLDMESIWSQIKEDKGGKEKNNSYTSYGKIKYYDTPVVTGPFSNKFVLDDLELNFVGVGLGFYRDRFVPDIGGKVTFIVREEHRGKKVMDFGLLYTNQFFYSKDAETGDFLLSNNGWLTAFAKFYSFGDVIGIGGGGLIHRKGDFYKGSTYKLSVFNKRPNSKFTFSPEFVFTNNFREFFPALRIGLSF